MSVTSHACVAPHQPELLPQGTQDSDDGKISEWLRSLIQGNVQPGASELLRLAEGQFGWRVRFLLLPVIQELRDDQTLRSYLRDYLKVTLCDEAVQQALRGEAKTGEEYQSTLDDLFRRSMLYRDSPSD